jgi:nicotinate-nucleotide adenylyltransferase
LGLEGGEFLTFGVRKLDISSTEVRNRIKNGKDVRFMVPEKVLKYVEEKGLYKG